MSVYGRDQDAFEKARHQMPCRSSMSVYGRDQDVSLTFSRRAPSFINERLRTRSRRFRGRVVVRRDGFINARVGAEGIAREVVASSSAGTGSSMSVYGRDQDASIKRSRVASPRFINERLRTRSRHRTPRPLPVVALGSSMSVYGRDQDETRLGYPSPVIRSSMSVYGRDQDLNPFTQGANDVAFINERLRTRSRLGPADTDDPLQRVHQ